MELLIVIDRCDKTDIHVVTSCNSRVDKKWHTLNNSDHVILVILLLEWLLILLIGKTWRMN